MFSLTCNGKPQDKTYFTTKRQTTSGTTRIGRIIINVNDEQQVGGKSGIQFHKIKIPKFFLRLKHYINWRPQLRRIPYDEGTQPKTANFFNETINLKHTRIWQTP